MSDKRDGFIYLVCFRQVARMGRTRRAVEFLQQRS